MKNGLKQKAIKDIIKILKLKNNNQLLKLQRSRIRNTAYEKWLNNKNIK